MMRILSLTIIVAVFLGALVLVVGVTAEETYKGEISENFDENIDQVWDILTTIELIPKIKRDVVQVEILARSRGLVTWKENLNSGGYRLYKMLATREPHRYVIQLIDSSNGVSGVWDYQLEEFGNKTKITLYEESKTVNIWTRGLHTFQGRNVRSKRDFKSLRVAIFDNLINTP